MNIEAINKWLDEEYGCSYTRLEELHDFYFEKYCDLKQENKQLKSILTELVEWLKETRINSAFIDEQTIMEVQLKIQELEQGSDSNEI